MAYNNKSAKTKKTIKKTSRFPILFIILCSLIGILVLQTKLYAKSQVIAAQLESQFLPTPTQTVLPKPTPQPNPVKKPNPKTASDSGSVVNHSQTNQIEVPVLMYHYIGNNPNPADHARDILSVTPDKFEAQMKYISESGFNPISFDQLYPALVSHSPLPPKPIILTFDDAYVDFYYNAYPILAKYNLSATVFVPTNLVGKPAYMNWDQIVQLNQTGRVHFLAHSQNHSDLTHLTAAQLTTEITESKKILEQKLGAPVNFMAYPYGTVNNTVIEAVKKAGYLGSAGTWESKFQSQNNLYDMPRLRITGNMSLETYKATI